jgi:glycosyltransferase involved in cell wall biosynthesis
MNTNSTLLTVITPVYNDSVHILETIDSVLKACTGISFEYLVIDDGSTDSTQQILLSYGKKINYQRKENGGQASAINLGFQLAKGKYCVIVNSDDPLPDSGLLGKSLDILEKEAGIICTYPDWSIIDNAGRIIKQVKVLDYSVDEMYGNFNCQVGPGGVFRTDLAKLVEGWDASFKYTPDYDFWLKLAQFGNFKRIPQNLAFWRYHPESISVKSKNKSMAIERIRVVAKHQYVLSNEPELNRRALANAYFSAATLVYFDSSIPGRKWAAKSLTLFPRIFIKKRIRMWVYLFTYPISHSLLKVAERCGIRKPMS